MKLGMARPPTSQKTFRPVNCWSVCQHKNNTNNNKTPNNIENTYIRICSMLMQCVCVLAFDRDYLFISIPECSAYGNDFPINCFAPNCARINASFVVAMIEMSVHCKLRKKRGALLLLQFTFIYLIL